MKKVSNGIYEHKTNLLGVHDLVITIAREDAFGGESKQWIVSVESNEYPIVRAEDCGLFPTKKSAIEYVQNINFAEYQYQLDCAKGKKHFDENGGF